MLELKYINEEEYNAAKEEVENGLKFEKGNTSSGAQKDATLENGMVIKVPLFISEGESVLVSTKDGKYVSRA